jgi:hypothetical protein
LPQYLINLANLSLVFQEYTCIKVRDFSVERPLANQLGFALVMDLGSFNNLVGWAFVALESTSAAASAASASTAGASTAASKG